MNEYQEIYTLFFSLFSAMAISITGKTHPFDTPSMFRWYLKSWVRFCYSILLLNFFPLLSFICIYNGFSKIENTHQISIGLALLMFLPSLVALGFYRIHYGSMLAKDKNGNYLFYDEDLYRGNKKKGIRKGLPIILSQDLDARPIIHTEPLPHIIPGILWIIVSIAPTLLFLKYCA